MNLVLVKEAKSMSESCVLVDEIVREVENEERLTAHADNTPQRAFFVYLFSSKGQLLLTSRTADKYLSAGLRTNTFCTHPLPSEPIQDAPHHCLRKEQGNNFEVVPSFQPTNREQLKNGLDHMFIAAYDGEPDLDPSDSDAYEGMIRGDSVVTSRPTRSNTLHGGYYENVW